jgi:hypothetical protein
MSKEWKTLELRRCLGLAISITCILSIAGLRGSAAALDSAQVSQGAVEPRHIDTWAYDQYNQQGAQATVQEVNALVTYAESGLGNDKPLHDCHVSGGRCKAVAYFDPNKVYDDPKCPYHPDSDFLADASEAWFVHQPGFSDSAHRVYGMYSRVCKGERYSIPVYDVNTGNPGVQQWWQRYLRAHLDDYDYYMLDDTSSDIVDQFYYQSGGGCQPWPSLCHSTNEFPNDASLEEAHVAFINSLYHRDGSPMYFFVNGGTTELVRDTDRVKGIVCEDCFELRGLLVTDRVRRVLDTIRATAETQAAFVLLAYSHHAPASPGWYQDRLIVTAIGWLGYSPGHLVLWPDLAETPHDLSIWPEDLIYPTRPLQSMEQGAGALEVAPGVWRREFGACYLKGVRFGRCACLLNSNPQSVQVRPSWLVQNYAHVITIAGGSVVSGGSVDVTGEAFNVESAVLEPSSGLLLAQ